MENIKICQRVCKHHIIIMFSKLSPLLCSFYFSKSCRTSWFYSSSQKLSLMPFHPSITLTPFRHGCSLSFHLLPLAAMFMFETEMCYTPCDGEAMTISQKRCEEQSAPPEATSTKHWNPIPTWLSHCYEGRNVLFLNH